MMASDWTTPTLTHVNDRIAPGVVALAAGSALVLILLVPYLALQFRRRGEATLRRTVLSAAFVVYVLGIAAYVLLPLPEVAANFCRIHQPEPQLVPFNFISEIRLNHADLNVLRRPATLQVAFNVLLFVPLGLFQRLLFGRGVLAATVIGLAGSLFVELTQLTGNWRIYPCSYRLFDVDDLIANTSGALIGALAAPALGFLAVRGHTRPAKEPRPVTAWRRLVGMACDLLSVTLIGGFLYTTYVVIARQFFDAEPQTKIGSPMVALLLFIVPALVQLAVIFAAGNTIGEWVIRVGPAGTWRLPIPIAVWRWLMGIGGFTLLSSVPSTTMAAALLIWLGLHAVGAFWPSDHRGLAYLLSGIRVRDDRAGDRVAHKTESRPVAA